MIAGVFLIISGLTMIVLAVIGLTINRPGVHRSPTQRGKHAKRVH